MYTLFTCTIGYCSKLQTAGNRDRADRPPEKIIMDDQEINEKNNYEQQLQIVCDKNQILKIKENKILSMKETIKKMKGELEQLEKKKEPSTFFIESNMEEQDQIRKALSRDKYNETLRTKFENIQLDLKMYFRQEQEIYDKIEEISSQIINTNEEMVKQLDYIVWLKEDIDIEKAILFHKNKALIKE